MGLRERRVGRPVGDTKPGTSWLRGMGSFQLPVPVVLPGPPAPMARRRLSTTTLASRAAQAGPRPVRRRSRRHRPHRSRTRSRSAFRQRSLPGVFSTNRSATGVASVRLEDGCRSLPRTRYRTSCLVGVPIAAKRNTPPFVDCFDEWSTCCHSRRASVRRNSRRLTATCCENVPCLAPPSRAKACQAPARHATPRRDILRLPDARTQAASGSSITFICATQLPSAGGDLS